MIGRNYKMIVIVGSQRGKTKEGGRQKDVMMISTSPTNLDGPAQEGVDGENEIDSSSIEKEESETTIWLCFFLITFF